MTKKCDGCGGGNCRDCGDHVHPWDGSHYCEPGQLRENAELRARFLATMDDATAVRSGSGMIHAVDCHIVRGHLKFAESPWPWMPWHAVHQVSLVGRTGQCCSPNATVQKNPRRMVRRLTGIGWPDDDGRCAKGRLPRWTKASQ